MLLPDTILHMILSISNIDIKRHFGCIAKISPDPKFPGSFDRIPKPVYSDMVDMMVLQIRIHDTKTLILYRYIYSSENDYGMLSTTNGQNMRAYFLYP